MISTPSNDGTTGDLMEVLPSDSTFSMAIVDVKNAMQALLYEMPNLNANNWNKVYVPISAICGRHTVTIFAYSIWNVRT
jgi:ABC-type enterobactin transport system permease subunit